MDSVSSPRRMGGPHATLLVNPRSVEAPLDGDPRGAWALYKAGEIRFCRTCRERRDDAFVRRLGGANRTADRAGSDWGD